MAGKRGRGLQQFFLICPENLWAAAVARCRTAQLSLGSRLPFDYPLLPCGAVSPAFLSCHVCWLKESTVWINSLNQQTLEYPMSLKSRKGGDKKKWMNIGSTFLPLRILYFDVFHFFFDRSTCQLGGNASQDPNQSRTSNLIHMADDSLSLCQVWHCERYNLV